MMILAMIKFNNRETVVHSIQVMNQAELHAIIWKKLKNISVLTYVLM